MTLVKLTPFLDSFEDLEKIFDDFGRFPAWKSGSTLYPLVDVYEDGRNLVVEAQLPGVDIKNVKVSIEDDVLIIKGEEKHKKEVDEKKYYLKETMSAVFQRLVKLPVQVVAGKAKAVYKNGVLKITVPKKEDKKQKQTINIEVKQ